MSSITMGLGFQSTDEIDTEWLDITLRSDKLDARFHVERYAWMGARIHGPNVANAACGSNYGAPHFKGCQVTGFDRDPEALRAAVRDGFVPVVEADVSEQTFDGFDALVTLETLEHLPDPWGWLSRLAPSVRELGLSVPIIPTKHFNRYHLHDFTTGQVVTEVHALGWKISDLWMQADDGLLLYGVR